MLKIGFTGTRGPKDDGSGMNEYQQAALKTFLKSKEFNEFHHGDCVGSDAQAHEIVTVMKDSGIDIKRVGHPPKYKKYRAFCDFDYEHKPHEYLKRNHYIVDDTDILIATPYCKEKVRSGTWATVRYARKKGRKIYIIHKSGRISVEQNGS
jgi:hypothetical protein